LTDPVTDDLPIITFTTDTAWRDWLTHHHADSPGLWLKIAKKNAPTPTVTYSDAIDEALCQGWIDGQKRPHDDHHWLQRFTPRGPRSRWSQRNRERAENLITTGRMQPAGQAQIDAARADGRWDAAYPGQATATVPDDLQAALDANPTAAQAFAALNSANRFAILYRIHDAKRPTTRAARIEKYVTMLAAGDTIHPT
jgi:uncharacterized protein YdeI (YjbR/CyaY-like superfamily)